MKVDNLCVVQARMGSTRLAGKVLYDLAGKTVLERVIERVLGCRLLSEVVVATGIGRENLPIVRFCSSRGIRVFCGSENDVLDRFYQLAKLFSPGNVVRITADCPLIDPAIIKRVLSVHRKSGADYTANTNPPTFPDGQDVEAFKFSALKLAWTKAALPSEREHVTPYIYKHPRIFKLQSVRNEVDLSGRRWTVDYQADMDFVAAIYRAWKKKTMPGMTDILELLESRPDILALSPSIARNVGYTKSLKEDKVFKRRSAQ